LSNSRGSGLSPTATVAVKKEFARQLRWSIENPPVYTWGRADDKEADCSGYVWNELIKAIQASAQASGLLVIRTTAIRMYQGLDGWDVFTQVPLDDAEESDIVWWTFTDDRPYGHVGALLLGDNGILQAAHASFSKKQVILAPVRYTMFSKISGLKRLK